MKEAENSTLLVMVMELSNNSELDDFDIEDWHQPALDNFELTCDAGRKVPLHHSIHSHIKETSKHENHLTHETKNCMHQILTNLLGIVVNSSSTL